MRDQKTDDEDEDEGCRPGGYSVVEDGEVRVYAVLFHSFVCEEEEDPDARPDCGAVEAEDVALQERVEAAWEEPEGSGEEDDSHDGAIFGFEAFEERDEGECVKEEVEDVAVEEGVGVESIYYRMLTQSFVHLG